MKELLQVAVGERFGRLVALEPTRIGGQRAFLCQCDCGKTKTVRITHLRRGLIRSCRCLIGEFRRKHGLYKTPEYRVWSDMKHRCGRKHGYEDVRVCAEWSEDFEVFLRDVGARPGPGFSIDRIDPFGHYEPGNVRWATPKEQSANRRPVPGVTVSTRSPRVVARERCAGDRHRAKLKAIRTGEPIQTTIFDLRPGLIHASKTTCAHGHSLVDGFVRKDGSVECVVCRRLRQRRSSAA